MNIPNLVYKSLDVATPYVSTIKKRCDVGACCNIAIGAGCNTLTVEQIVRIYVIQAPKLACDICY